jgi:E1-E2 ATPase/cation transport ATPase-like protein
MSTTGSKAIEIAYRLPAAVVVVMLDGDADHGLTEQEACRRLQRYGANGLHAAPSVPAWRTFAAQFQSPLVVLLLIATLVSLTVWLVERESAVPYEAAVIFVIVLVNAVLGYLQEERAEQAVAALRAMSAATATVLREGSRRQIPAAEVVPGDLLLVEEGDAIAADARLLTAVALQAAEASLTGESLASAKDSAPIAEVVGIGDRHNMIFSGTAATHCRRRPADPAAALGCSPDRRADPGGRPGGCGGTRGVGDHPDHHPGTGHAAHGRATRDRPQARCRRDVGVGHRHRHGQDRHPDQERDDRADGHLVERSCGYHWNRL